MDEAKEYRDWSYREIECVSTASSTFVPHDHQKEAWRKLDQLDIPRRALLVLPTGAGKTHTAVSWLLKNVLSEPSERPILWIAHRAELLQQAAKTFNELRCLARRNTPLKLRCISGAHGKPITTLLKHVDISLCTIQSMSTKKGREVVNAYFDKNKHCVIVIDEAHHAAAQSYRDVISPILRRRNIEILGLTATPTRTIKAEVDRLKRIFSQGIVYQIDLPTLIERGVLSRPICSTVRTGLNFDRHLTIKELKYLKTFGDLPDSVLHKIASHGPRNRLIVNHYLQNSETFGKTLVFATGIGHCYALAKHFRDNGISADYVASVRNDHSTNEEVIKRFRQGKIDVLVNVMLLTEGVDLPSTDSVFLARPTSSEILMRQMVGRGMRGPLVGGGPEVRIVSFADHWERFIDWLDPIALVSEGMLDESNTKKTKQKKLLSIPWELFSAALEIAPDLEPSAVFSSTPIGWYDLQYSDPSLGQATAILVYDQQHEAYKRFISAAREGQYVLTGRGGPLNRYFGDIQDPRPSTQSLVHLARYIDQYGRPKFISFADRDEFNPDLVAARNIRLPIDQLAKLAEKTYDETLANKFYDTKDRYVSAVIDATKTTLLRSRRAVDEPLLQPKGGARLPDDGRFNLVRIRDKVIKEMNLEKDPPEVRWSHLPMSSRWGVYRGSDQTIVINKVLNTTKVLQRTIEFLMYHELLHHELGVETGHNDFFRSRESKFSGYLEAEAELDTLLETYSIPSVDRKPGTNR